jgi:hypothetical protein
VTTFEERRAHPRHACRVPVTIIADDFSWLVNIVDYSEGGVCIESSLQPAVGSELDLRFHHPEDSRMVVTRGVVRHSGRPLDAAGDKLGIGVQFAA